MLAWGQDLLFSAWAALTILFLPRIFKCTLLLKKAKQRGLLFMKNTFQNSDIAHPVNDNKVFVRENFSPGAKSFSRIFRG